MARPQRLRIVEVGPRDGLQNEAQPVSVASRIRLIEMLAEAGLTTIEAGSFVSPRWVPQMAGTAEVLAGLPPLPGVELPVLVPNLRGLVSALAADVREIAVFVAASEGFSRANINCSVADGLARAREVAAAARPHGIRVRGYISCALGCPYDGLVTPEAVAEVSAALDAMGCTEISLGDTIGVGTPPAARAMVEAVAARVPAERLALHFHDTGGRALENVRACLPLGIASIDAAVGGLGGCPYAKGAPGNLATEALVPMLEELGIETGVDLAKLREASRFIRGLLATPPEPHARAWPGHPRVDGSMRKRTRGWPGQARP